MGFKSTIINAVQSCYGGKKTEQRINFYDKVAVRKDNYSKTQNRGTVNNERVYKDSTEKLVVLSIWKEGGEIKRVYLVNQARQVATVDGENLFNLCSLGVLYNVCFLNKRKREYKGNNGFKLENITEDMDFYKKRGAYRDKYGALNLRTLEVIAHNRLSGDRKINEAVAYLRYLNNPDKNENIQKQEIEGKEFTVVTGYHKIEQNVTFGNFIVTGSGYLDIHGHYDKGLIKVTGGGTVSIHGKIYDAGYINILSGRVFSNSIAVRKNVKVNGNTFNTDY